MARAPPHDAGTGRFACEWKRPLQARGKRLVSWAKLDDGFWAHPKVMGVGNVGAGIFARFLAYCGDHLTEGLVPAPVVGFIVGDDAAALEALERFAMVQIQDSGSVLVPDYLEHNPTRAKVKADREQRAEAGRRGGSKSRTRRAAA